MTEYFSKKEYNDMVRSKDREIKLLQKEIAKLNKKLDTLRNKAKQA